MRQFIRRFDSLPLHLRFLVVPLLGLLLAGLLVLSFALESQRQNALLQHVANKELPALDRLTGTFSSLTREHTELIALLYDARNRLDEGELYERAKVRIESMRHTREQLGQMLTQPYLHNDERDRQIDALRKELLRQSLAYFKSADAAIELSTLNLDLASRELVAANTKFVTINQQFVHSLGLARQGLGSEIQQSAKQNHQRIFWLGVVALLLGSASILATVLLTRRLSRDLDKQIATLVRLGNNADAAMDPTGSGNEIESMSGAIAAFGDALDRLKEGEARLTMVNSELLQARDLLEWRVEERTRALCGAIAELQDEVERRREAEQRLRIYAEVVASTSEGIIIAAMDHTVLDVNPAYLAVTGYSREDVVGSRLLEKSVQPATAHSGPAWREQLARHGRWNGELLLNRQDGKTVPCLTCINEVAEHEEHAAGHVVSICHDISELRQHEARLEYQSMHDALTGLPNRVLLIDRLQWAISRGMRDNKRFAVMFIDLDKFKDINDTLGHSAGDQLLIGIAERLAGCLRDGDMTARLGGDEFVVVVDPIEDEHIVSQLAQRILAMLAAPMRLGGEEHRLSCSVGISLFPEDGTDPDVLMKHADIAMYRAKEAGRNNAQFFKQEMQQRLGERLSLERQLQRGLERDEFVLHFQPKVDLRSGRISGFEALIRWQSPELGLVLPARFIPLAEESNLIQGIGEWVLEKACRSIREWVRQGLNVVPVAVNVAASQFVHHRIDRLTAQVLHTTGIDPQYLELELTESMSMVDPEASIVLMHQLKDKGISLAIDDFGTGYSNLSYLKRFPVDKIKIDRSFVQGLAYRPEEQAISAAIIGLSHALGLRAIAEGVETANQLQLLAMLGCDEIQGYYFSRPIPEAEANELLACGARLDLEKIKRMPYRRTVLLVESDPRIVSGFRRLLHDKSLELLTAGNTGQAYELLARHEVGVVISGHRIPHQDGMALLLQVKKMYPRMVRILLAGQNDNGLAASGKDEVFDVILTPLQGEPAWETLLRALCRYEQTRTCPLERQIHFMQC